MKGQEIGRIIKGKFYLKHKNGGGLKTLTAQVDESVYMGPKAQVEDYASVWNGAVLDGGTVLKGHVLVVGPWYFNGQEVTRGIYRAWPKRT